MKRKLSTFFLVLSNVLSATLLAQQSESVFNFLAMPRSAHETALGGNAISLIDDDASLLFSNPALLSSVSDKTINLNYMTYLQGCNAGSAAFAKVCGERSTWGVTAQFVSYGSMEETTEANEVIGSFTPLDLALAGMYAYNLNDSWAGGSTGKFIYSSYAGYNSIALAVDLGLNYFNGDTDFSFSVVAQNLGGQVKAFGDDHERLPFNLQAGFTKGLSHLPLRFTISLTDLTRWDKDYYYDTEGDISTGRFLLNHFTLGVDIIPISYLYAAVGYNFRRASELKAVGSGHAAGLSAGVGLHLSRLNVDIAYSQYHMSVPALVFGVAYRL